MLTDWPGEAPTSAVSQTQDVVGRGVITKIYAKEPILEPRLALKGAGGGFAATIPQGMRAVAVAVNEVVGVAGFAVAGMHVDVIISGAPLNGTAGRRPRPGPCFKISRCYPPARTSRKTRKESLWPCRWSTCWSRRVKPNTLFK